MTLLAIQGVSGLAGGLGLTVDPSGASVGLPLEWLASSPFSDYLIPGIVLFVLLGVAPLIAVYGVWTRRSWAWITSVGIGVTLLVWLGVEIAVIGYQPEPPLQVVYGVLGILILMATLSRSVRARLAGSGG